MKVIVFAFLVVCLLGIMTRVVEEREARETALSNVYSGTSVAVSVLSNRIEETGEAVTYEQLDKTITECHARENEIESMINILYTYVKTCTTGTPPERLMDAVEGEIDFTVTNGTMVAGYLTLAVE
jgi:hypothetical protein